MYHAKEFLDYLNSKGYAQSTIRYYFMMLNDFIRYLESMKITDVRGISKKDIIHYFNRISSNRDMVTMHQKVKMLRIRIYFEYLQDSQKIFISPLRDFVPPKLIKSSYPALKDKTIKKMLNSIQPIKPNFIKARAILELMYSAALRTREVYNLRISDIDFQKEMLFIEQSKNKKDRIVPVGRKALYWIGLYLNDVRPKYAKKYHDYVFINHKNGCQLTGYGLLKVVNKTLAAIHSKPIKLYSLRVSAATTLLKNGMSISYISKILGHTELNTTNIYLRVKEKQLKNELSNKHPRNLNAERINSKGEKNVI